MYKWTYTIQTHTVQESTIFYSFKHNFEKYFSNMKKYLISKFSSSYKNMSEEILRSNVFAKPYIYTLKE